MSVVTSTSALNWHEQIRVFLDWHPTVITLAPSEASDLLDEWEDAQERIKRLTEEADQWREIAFEANEKLCPTPSPPAWTVIA